MAAASYRRMLARGLTCDEQVLYTLMRGLLAPHEMEEAMERAKSKKVSGSQAWME